MSSFVSVADWVSNKEGNDIVNLYTEKYNSAPEWIIRCPGRVNLIGEHIDHNGYSVLPMAIRLATFVAVGRSNDRLLHFENVESNKYRSATCEVDTSISDLKLDSKPEWFHYFVAGWRGALESVFDITGRPFSQELIGEIAGLNVAVAGIIPPSAGLSSSSALVCAATLSTLAIQTCRDALHTVDRSDLAEIATKAERYVGTEGGGMDQACECLAQTDYALRIDFNPLAFVSVKLPRNALFAVVHSGTEMNKAATDFYNQRVVECRLAAQILCKKAGKLSSNSIEIMQKVRTLRHAAEVFELDGEDPSKMLEFVENFLDNGKEGRYSREEICEILQISSEQLIELALNSNTINVQEFCLAKRAQHVYSEASRVLKFERICNAAADDTSEESGGDQPNRQKKVLEELASLMNDSHSSCRDDFECSCKELDELVSKCRAAGCLAARLTGAGWGGCAVALVDADHRAVIDAQAKALNILFWSEPCEGIKAFQFMEKQ